MAVEDQFLRLREMYMRYLGGHSWQLDTQQVKFRSIVLAECLQDVRDHISQQSHYREMVLDKAKFGVQADIFIDMARGVVRLGAEDRADLEDALEDTNHDLLVELWTLCQVGGPSKVVQLKDVSSTLGCSGYNLRCLNLRKAACGQRGAEAGHGTCAEPQDGTPGGMAIGHSGMVEQGRDVRREFRFVQGYGWYLG